MNIDEIREEIVESARSNNMTLFVLDPDDFVKRKLTPPNLADTVEFVQVQGMTLRWLNFHFINISGEDVDMKALEGVCKHTANTLQFDWGTLHVSVNNRLHGKPIQMKDFHYFKEQKETQCSL